MALTEKKIAVKYNGSIYMLKFAPSAQDKQTSYTNSCFSEHIASNIFNMLGVTAHKTILGTYCLGGKDKIVCACLDFTSDGHRLLDFCSIKNTVLESDTKGTGTELDDILDTIKNQQYIPPEQLENHFWDMFIVDALLGNFDRHNGNWGFLVDESFSNSSIAPVYDCGSCLLPQADEQIMSSVLTDENELRSRIYVFPASIIKSSGRKINYFDFLQKLDYEKCRAAVKRIVPLINMDEIDAFIDEVPYLSSLQKDFYKRYIRERYNLILIPALANAEAIEQMK